ncbi:MAG: glycosyltransferase family 4 protein [Acidobacteriota bacterium]
MSDHREAIAIGLVGPHLGKHPGWVVSQGEILAERFASEGHPVFQCSTRIHPLARLFDSLVSVLRWRRRVDALILAVYSGRAFHIAEWVSRLAARSRHPRLVLHLHGGGLPELFAARPERARSVLDRADLIVTPTAYLAEAVGSLGGERPILTIPNVFDLDGYEYRRRDHLPEAPRILWMRTVHEIYRPELAIEALARLHARGVDARLTLAGQDKGLLDRCRQRVTALDLDAAVDFPGFLDPDAKRRAFAEHDVFWSTNRVDNAPVSVLEALASGLPVVAAAVGGLPRLLHTERGDAGLLVPDDGDDVELAERFADATSSLIAQPTRVRQLVDLGRGVAEASAWPAVYRRWLDVFTRLGSASNQSQ